MRAVVFDLDGTLIDSLPDMTASANALLSQEGLPPLAKADVAGFVGFGVRVFMDRLIAATALSTSDYDTLLERFMALYVDATDHTEVYPHVHQALADLSDAGFVLGICTNKPQAPMRSVLRAVGLDTVFDVAIAGDTLPQRKPDPMPLRRAFGELGAIQGLYVGDSIVDAQTARSAGVPFALFTEGIRVTPLGDVAHDASFDDFRALPAICERLCKPLSQD